MHYAESKTNQRIILINEAPLSCPPISQSVSWHDKEDGASSTGLREQLQLCEWGSLRREREWRIRRVKVEET